MQIPILVLKDGKVESIGTKEKLEKVSKTYKEIKNLQIDTKEERGSNEK